MIPPGPPTSIPPGLIPPGPPPGPPPKEAFRFNTVGYSQTEGPMSNVQGKETTTGSVHTARNAQVAVSLRSPSRSQDAFPSLAPDA